MDFDIRNKTLEEIKAATDHSEATLDTLPESPIMSHLYIFLMEI